MSVDGEVGMRAFDSSRIVYYEPNDWALGESIAKCKDYLNNYKSNGVADINNAIEIVQCRKILDEYSNAFDPADLSRLSSNLQIAVAEAFSFVRQSIVSDGLDVLFEALEAQYFDQFWDLIEDSNALKAITSSAFQAFLLSNPDLIRTLLYRGKIVKTFGDSLAYVMRKNPFISAETIISGLGIFNTSSRNIFIPKELKSQDIDRIMDEYLRSSAPNINYVHALANWPTSAKEFYAPASKIRVFAKRKEQNLHEELFNKESGIEYGICVKFDDDQAPCFDVQGTMREPVFSFGSQWLAEYHDYASVLNNFIFVFSFVNHAGLLTMPANPRLVSTLMKAIGVHAKDEYAIHDHSFFINNSRCLAASAGYASILEKCGTSIEASIEWFYNAYISDYFTIDGFSILLSKSPISFFERCKSIGPEIERVVKAFSLLVKDGEIDHDLFRYTPFKDFGAIPSFITKKYAFPGKDFDSYSYTLFSDQSILYVPPERGANHKCLFDCLQAQNLTIDDFCAFQQNELKRLKALNLIDEDSESFFKPTFRAVLLKKVWQEGALTPYRLPDDICFDVEELVDEGCLQYKSALFAPHEADYMNFMFNNARFSNARGLRNVYDHASGSASDPNSSTCMSDYYQLLNLLLCITLKINDELAWKDGTWPELDFVDWPLYGDGLNKIAH